MPIYLNALKQYGFDTSLIPAKLHVAIMEESERDSLSGGDWDGLDKNDVVEGGLSLTGELVALLVLGPSAFDSSGVRSFTNTREMIEELVGKWIAEGPRGTFDLRILSHLDKAGFLSTEFANAFRAEHARQEPL